MLGKEINRACYFSRVLSVFFIVVLSNVLTAPANAQSGDDEEDIFKYLFEKAAQKAGHKVNMNDNEDFFYKGNDFIIANSEKGSIYINTGQLYMGADSGFRFGAAVPEKTKTKSETKTADASPPTKEKRCNYLNSEPAVSYDQLRRDFQIYQSDIKKMSSDDLCIGPDEIYEVASRLKMKAGLPPGESKNKAMKVFELVKEIYVPPYGALYITGVDVIHLMGASMAVDVAKVEVGNRPVVKVCSPKDGTDCVAYREPLCRDAGKSGDCHSVGASINLDVANLFRLLEIIRAAGVQEQSVYGDSICQGCPRHQLTLDLAALSNSFFYAKDRRIEELVNLAFSPENNGFSIANMAKLLPLLSNGGRGMNAAADTLLRIADSTDKPSFDDVYDAAIERKAEAVNPGKSDIGLLKREVDRGIYYMDKPIDLKDLEQAFK